jgi:hypothetical protein
MGFFYTNITLKGPTQEQVVSYLRRQSRDAYVSPTINDITVVYDRECEDQDTDVLQRVAFDLSRAFDCPALVALVHDDDVLWYALYEHGAYIDAYNSVPDYWDDSEPSEPSGGDARALCMAFGAEQAIQEVDALLHFAPLTDDPNDAAWDTYLPAEDLHQALARALGFPAYAYSMGYDFIASYDSADESNTPVGRDISRLVKTLP